MVASQSTKAAFAMDFGMDMAVCNTKSTRMAAKTLMSIKVSMLVNGETIYVMGKVL